MTLGEFREKTKDLPDDYNLILSIYSNIDGKDFIDEIDVMSVTPTHFKKELYILN